MNAAETPSPDPARPLAQARPVAHARSLAPKEHGAYGQLGVPLCTALGMGRPSLAAALLTAAALAAFFAHEPLLVAIGHRGARARREDGPRARRVLAGLGAAALLFGASGLALAPPEARVAALAPLALTAIVAFFIARDAERSTPGEIAAAAALSSAALPVALAASVPAPVAIEALLAFSVAFGAATVSVRSVIASQKTQTSRARRLLPLLASALAVTALCARGLLSPWAAAAIAPTLLLSLALAASPPHPRALRAIGFSLVGTSLLAASLLIAGARL